MKKTYEQLRGFFFLEEKKNGGWLLAVFSLEQKNKGLAVFILEQKIGIAGAVFSGAENRGSLA